MRSRSGRRNGMEDGFRFADAMGPAKVVYIHQPAARLRAIVVVDNVAAGPAIGGTRMAPDVSAEECFRLARAMTFKNAAAGLPHGGAKSVIFGDPAMPRAEKERIVRAFARAIADIADYIPGPDMGTDETAMAWIKDEIGRAVGLPAVIGGIPLDQIGATGFGLATAAEVAADSIGLTLRGARVAIQGFGAVGQHAARFLGEKGAILVAVSDTKGTILDADGIDVGELRALKASGRSVTDLDGAKKSGLEDVISAECDILVPAARPDVIHPGNVETVKARLLLQGANIPATVDAERRLHEKGVLSIPDFIANAGGVITASIEYHGGSERAAFETIEAKIRANTQAVLASMHSDGLSPRDAAVGLARDRIEKAMELRRFHM